MPSTVGNYITYNICSGNTILETKHALILDIHPLVWASLPPVSMKNSNKWIDVISWKEIPENELLLISSLMRKEGQIAVESPDTMKAYAYSERQQAEASGNANLETQILHYIEKIESIF